MDKRLILPQNIEGRRDVYFVREDRQYLRKHASSYHPKIASYIENAKPLPDLIQVLLTALGAYEFWGQNVNGDRFKVPALTHEGDDYGYQTFKSNASYFTHHVNKDPALAKGKVLHAVWNEAGKRVELIVGINPALDPEGAAAVDRGDDLTFSMGAKVPFDVCSICAHQAKTRAEYCEHLRYLMNQIDPISNQLVGADNLYPKFFDISRVLIPADKTAHIWTKVASASNPYRMLGSAELADLPAGKINDTDYLLKKVAEQAELSKEKLASHSKKSTITKRIELKLSPEFTRGLERAIPLSKALLQETASPLKEEILERIKRDYPLKSILSTLAALAMELKSDEARHLLSGLPEKDLETLSLDPKHFNSELARLFISEIPDRSFARPILVRRITILAKKLEDNEPEIVKKAESIRDLVAQEPHPKGIHPGYVAGLLAALYALFGPHSSGLSKSVGRFLVDYPYLSLPLGAAALAGANVLNTPSQSGFYNVDDSISGLYNKNWQSRFVDLQARPVTVIKTGAAKADPELAKKLFYGVPSIYLGSKILKSREEAQPHKQPGTVSHFVANNPDLLAAGLIGEHLAGRPVSTRVHQAIESSKRFLKTASIRDPEFLKAVPGTERELIWDLAILDAADRISKRLLGG